MSLNLKTKIQDLEYPGISSKEILERPSDFFLL
jgi:hypothetical protein